MLNYVKLFGTPLTVAQQAPLSMEISRQEYWSRLPFPSPSGLPIPGTKPVCPALQADSLPVEPPGKPICTHKHICKSIHVYVHIYTYSLTQASLVSRMVKESACNAGDLGLIPVLGRSSGGGHGNPLQYSCLEKPMDRGAWRAIVHGVTKRSQTQLSD